MSFTPHQDDQPSSRVIRPVLDPNPAGRLQGPQSELHGADATPQVLGQGAIGGPAGSLLARVFEEGRGEQDRLVVALQIRVLAKVVRQHRKKGDLARCAERGYSRSVHRRLRPYVPMLARSARPRASKIFGPGSRHLLGPVI
jgi:hypothetical protein